MGCGCGGGGGVPPKFVKPKKIKFTKPKRIVKAKIPKKK